MVTQQAVFWMEGKGLGDSCLSETLGVRKIAKSGIL